MKIGKTVRRFERCTSTLDEARILAFQGEEEGLVVAAEEQTAGRGTRGRNWFSALGKGLYVTVILRPETRDLSLLPLVAGLAAWEAVSGMPGITAGLKWPNDLVWNSRKLGGVLGESGRDERGDRFLLLGIGINVDHDRDDFPPEIREKAASLKIAGGRPVDKEHLFQRLCEALEKWYNIYKCGRREDVVRAFQDKMIYSPGERICLESGSIRIEGTYAGLDAAGGLICEEGGRKTIYRSAEILAAVNE